MEGERMSECFRKPHIGHVFIWEWNRTGKIPVGTKCDCGQTELIGYDDKGMPIFNPDEREEKK